jgi:hypothetical protein
MPEKYSWKHKVESEMGEQLILSWQRQNRGSRDILGDGFQSVTPKFWLAEQSGRRLNSGWRYESKIWERGSGLRR